MQNTFSQSGNDSKWFFKKIFFRIGMWHLRPPRDPSPLHGKCHLKFPFWFSAHLPYKYRALAIFTSFQLRNSCRNMWRNHPSPWLAALFCGLKCCPKMATSCELLSCGNKLIETQLQPARGRDRWRVNWGDWYICYLGWKIWGTFISGLYFWVLWRTDGHPAENYFRHQTMPE